MSSPLIYFNDINIINVFGQLCKKKVISNVFYRKKAYKYAIKKNENFRD